MGANTYAALLRGINVGGKHSLPMKDLVEIFSASKCKDVCTYIQSGNVVFSAPADLVKGLRPMLEKKIEERFGFTAPVIFRSHEQLAKVVRDNPFRKAGKPEITLYVSFLADVPGAEAIGKLDANRSPGDEFRVIGQRNLFVPAERNGQIETNQYLLRFQAIDDQYCPELDDGAQAARNDEEPKRY